MKEMPFSVLYCTEFMDYGQARISIKTKLYSKNTFMMQERKLFNCSSKIDSLKNMQIIYFITLFIALNAFYACFQING